MNFWKGTRQSYLHVRERIGKKGKDLKEEEAKK